MKHILLLLFVLQSTTALCKKQTHYQLVVKRVDSLLRIGNEYKDVLKKIAAIPDSIKEEAVMTLDSVDNKGNKIHRDVCRYAVGYKAKGADEPHFVYYVWYSDHQNNILYVSEKETWDQATSYSSNPFTSKAKKQLSESETQNFYRLIRLTKEFIACKQKSDSFNRAVGAQQMHQEIKLEIITKEQQPTSDDNIFDALLERRLTIGMSMERYFFQYDKQKKQIVSVRCEKGRFQMN